VNGDEILVLIVVIAIVAGVTLMIATMSNRRRFRELEHRERLAMIERGLIPSPESNPARFESAAGLKPPADAPRPGESYRTAGVLMIGVGLGHLMLISFAAGAPGAGVGIGGAFAVLGAASLLNYSLISRREEERTQTHWTPPARHPEPPTNTTP
jgi:Flp pilus assembly protein TadB